MAIEEEGLKEMLNEHIEYDIGMVSVDDAMGDVEIFSFIYDMSSVDERIIRDWR